ncbi:Protein of unknown function [Spirosomataceae bacterium TFI 002]|nr:Protein of unknown function [Spirosomataceae bacterium TFI 002]
MKESLVIINSIILFFLSCVHFYWALGGKKWLVYALPTNTNPTSSLNFSPGFFATMIVGLGLLAFSVIVGSNISIYEDTLYSVILTRVIGAIFIIRAIGDFNYVGIKKKIKETVFAKKDSQLFIPLCFWLGISSILITFIP